MKIISQNKGFTLVELIVSVTFIALVITISANILFLTIDAHETTEAEYELQSAMRLASEKTNNTLRYSSAIFTIPEGRFFDANLTDGWSYFGVSADKSEIVEYIYEERMVSGVPTLDHYKNVLVAAQDGISYDITFEKNWDDESVIRYKIVGTSSNSNVDKIVFESEIEAVNALQIVDRGTSVNPAIAVAYRSDDRPVNQVVGVITMVIDTSGSMGWGMTNNQSAPLDEQKLTMVKKSLRGYTRSDGVVVEGMINEFAKEDLIQICIVPFDYSANYPETNVYNTTNSAPEFYDVNDSSDKSDLEAYVDSLDDGGGTNTGDGMRRAYHRNIFFRGEVEKEYETGYQTSDYMIILVDGVTNRSTKVEQSGTDPYFMDDGYAKGTSTGAVSTGDPYTTSGSGDDYVDDVGQLIDDANIKTYVIGYSELADELVSVQGIADATNAVAKYDFTEGLNLDTVFQEIKNDIMMDLWHIRGPQY